VESAIDRTARGYAGERVGRIGERRSAMDIAGKLIEQNDERERVWRMFFPGRKLAGRGALD
jgi:hypothetical protein